MTQLTILDNAIFLIRYLDDFVLTPEGEIIPFEKTNESQRQFGLRQVVGLSKVKLSFDLEKRLDERFPEGLLERGDLRKNSPFYARDLTKFFYAVSNSPNFPVFRLFSCGYRVTHFGSSNQFKDKTGSKKYIETLITQRTQTYCNYLGMVVKTHLGKFPLVERINSKQFQVSSQPV